MSGSGYGSQQQPFGMGGAPAGTQQPLGAATPMQKAFAPQNPLAGMATTNPVGGGGMGDSGQVAAGGTDSAMGSPWGGQAGGNMGAPQLDGLGGFDPRTGTMGGGAMGKQGGGVNPLSGMATTNPVNGMGGGVMGGPSPSGGYGDYMNRRNTWIDQLRGYVAQPMQPPQSWGGGPPVAGPPATSSPPGGPYPGAPKAASGGVDHMANMRALMGEDPRLANEYRTRNGDTINWWQQNQGNVASGLFGGDQGKMQEWLRGTTAATSNAAPLSQQEMMRLNQMAGIRGPSWMR